MTTSTDSPEHVPGQLSLTHHDGRPVTREELDRNRAELIAEGARLDFALLQHRDEALADVKKRTATAAEEGRLLDLAVAEARGLDATWQQIADAAGMTRQSAWRRWGKVPDDFLPGMREDGA
jgi:hypothetical protein